MEVRKYLNDKILQLYDFIVDLQAEAFVYKIKLYLIMRG